VTGVCWDSPLLGENDVLYTGPINTWDNAIVYLGEDGSCAGAVFGRKVMIVEFPGVQADAQAFCESIHPGIAYIENSQARGYPVPNANYWLCL